MSPMKRTLWMVVLIVPALINNPSLRGQVISSTAIKAGEISPAGLNSQKSWEIRWDAWKNSLPCRESAVASVWVVTNTADTGSGSLRWAIQLANGSPELDSIRFNIPKSDPGYNAARGVWTIAPQSSLPTITGDGLTIDGFSQAAFSGKDENPFGPEILLTGKDAGPSPMGLRVSASGIQILGLTINAFFESIWMRDGGLGRIAGCYVGTDFAGDSAVPNGYGIVVGTNCHDVIIVPNDSLTPNLVSGNTQGGIFVARSSRVSVIGNIVGLNRSATDTIPNRNYGGICVHDTSDSVSVFDNWIGGNRFGIDVFRSSHTIIQNNYIGTKRKPGEVPDFGNEFYGIWLAEGATDNLIADNHILYSGSYGVYVSDTNSVHNRISHNCITHNGGAGIETMSGGNKELTPPAITNVTAASVIGTALPNVSVEIYTDSSGEGSMFQGETRTTPSGDFTWTGALVGGLPHVTALVIDDDGNTSEFSTPVHISSTAVKDPGNRPCVFALNQNFPNPFNPSTVISYQLSAVGSVRLVVYDILGREVAVLVDGKKMPGSFDVRFDASGLASGVYFCRLETRDHCLTRAMLLLK